MRLHRLVMVELRPAPQQLRRRILLRENGVEVSINDFEGCDDVTEQPELPPTGTSVRIRRVVEQAPARVALSAVTQIHLEAEPDGRVMLSADVTADSEAALAKAAGILAVLTQSQFEVYSPRPYAYLEPETDDESELLGSRVHLPGLALTASMVAPGGGSTLDVAGLLQDRPQGLKLLAAALAAGHGVPKLHELIRVFEHAFAVGGARLVDPLLEFLRSYPEWDLGWTHGEVRHWIQGLRDPATHADLRLATRVLMDPDVEEFLPRIEQAAYDVLFNKANWHRADPARAQRWVFNTMLKRDGSPIVSAGGSIGGLGEWDHMRAFRLNENYRIHPDGIPSTWVPVDWYFADAN